MRLLPIILLISLSFLTICNTEIEYSTEKRSVLDSYMDKTPKELFKIWHMLFSKAYTFDSDEAKTKFSNFKANLVLIKEENLKNEGFKLGLNQFSDMTNEEFKAQFATYRPLGAELEEIAKTDPTFLPVEENDEDDLTKRNLQLKLNTINYSTYFKGVRDQGNCGGCWAFALTGALEGNKSKKTGVVQNFLSPQQLLDCDTNNRGCSGGDMRTGYNYIKARGVQLENDYYFYGYSSTCRYNYSKPLTYITGYQYCSNASVYKCSTAIVYSLLAKGPVAVTIDGGSYLFQNYMSGVFSGYCSTINHAVTLVGYGISGTQIYWLIKNSWGANWGEKGFIRVAVNPLNSYSCFIEYEAILPLV